MKSDSAVDMENIVMLVAALVITLIGASIVYAASKKNEAATEAVKTLPDGQYEQAIFAAGCFWCVESEFEAIEGVVDVESGYTGGTTRNPTYAEVSGHGTGHYEAVRVVYDPAKVTYERLLKAFWLIHDPTQVDGQGVDIGPQYRSAIFYHDEAQKQAAEASREAEESSGRYRRPIATKILPEKEFYPAEGYHQDYNTKKGVKYKSVFEQGESTTLKKRRSWGF